MNVVPQVLVLFLVPLSQFKAPFPENEEAVAVGTV
jgi:hypothetical protein